MPVISEAHNNGGFDDISTIYAYDETGKFAKSWSCFNNDYQRGQEHEFIATQDYPFFMITWDGSN